jgi:ankyrin repeat protein
MISLNEAVRNNDLQQVKRIVDRYIVGNFLNRKDFFNQKDEALIIASDNGYLDIVKYLAEHNADIHAHDDIALRWAVEGSHFDVVKYLVEQGINIHRDCDDIITSAAGQKNLEILKYLVEHGVNIHASNDYAIEYAVENDRLDSFKYLISLFTKTELIKLLLQYKGLYINFLILERLYNGSY